MENKINIELWVRVVRKEIRKGRFYYDPYVYYEQAEGESYYGKLFFARVRERTIPPSIR